MKKLILLLIFLTITGMYAQETQVSGVVFDENNQPLSGTSVSVKGRGKKIQTDNNGKYSISAEIGNELEFSHTGFGTVVMRVSGPTLNPTLISSTQELDDVVVGSRSRGRTITESAVPIDVISMKDIASQGPQSNLNQMLTMVAPSFKSNTQTIADGTDHIDPAQLRNLGPDQVLVLVNGKRRHTTSLVNNTGSVGRGSVGTDLNAIPSFAVEKIEVLRDGASAQYGSDAIAGVINLGLKKNTNKFDMNIFSGSNFTKNAPGGNDGNHYQIDMNYGTDLGKENSFINLTASFQVRNSTNRAGDRAGTIFNGYNAIEQRASEKGQDINSLFGNITNTPNTDKILADIKNYSSDISYLSDDQRKAINDATSITQMQSALKFDATDKEMEYRHLQRKDFKMRVGQSSLQSGQFFLNSVYPINDKVEVYLFGGSSYRDGLSAGFFRLPNTFASYSAVYPNGFLPEINSTVIDYSVAAGVKGKIFNNWNFDLSNTFGRNTFRFDIENTMNTSSRANSLTNFYAGGFGFSQNTINFDISKKFDFLSGLNVAFGAENRSESYQIKKGQEESYNLYDINGNVIKGTVPDNTRVTDFFGNLRPGGSQVFAGFRPSNVVDKGRNSEALYTDIELDVTKKWLVNGAVRFENYSDFGNTVNYKLATRYKILKNINLRGALSTGFRAPSLHQIYFSTTATLFSNGAPTEVGTFSNDSQIAKIFGIPKLKQEESLSKSIGFTVDFPKIKTTITADAYMIDIKNRVILTGSFARPTGTPAAGTPEQVLQGYFDEVGASTATFFSNGIDTQSKGLDIVISNRASLGNEITLKTDLAGTFATTKRVGNIHASKILEENGLLNSYFSENSRVYLEDALPKTKINLTNTVAIKKFDFFLRNVYFGKITDPNTADINGDGRVEGEIINGQAVETEHSVFNPKIITDFSVGYKITTNLKVVAGANNLFDIYPDKIPGPISAIKPRIVDGKIDYTSSPTITDLSNGNQFIYSRNASQFGQNGRFIFIRLNYSF